MDASWTLQWSSELVEQAEIQSSLGASSLIRACEPVRPTQLTSSGAFRIQTKFRYPGGEFVDLFLHPCPDGRFDLSDDGFTMGHLLSVRLDPDSTMKRRDYVADVCGELGVTRRGGEFLVTGLRDAASLPDAAIRLGQACVRIADLSLTHRSRTPTPFVEEFEEGLDDLDLPFRRNVPLPGRRGQSVMVDYVVDGPRIESLLLTLTATQAARAHDLANDAFIKWWDLKDHQTSCQFINVLDSSKASLFRASDLDRLEEFSTTVRYPDETPRLRDLILA